MTCLAPEELAWLARESGGLCSEDELSLLRQAQPVFAPVMLDD
jgi:hypothetical protein